MYVCALRKLKQILPFCFKKSRQNLSQFYLNILKTLKFLLNIQKCFLILFEFLNLDKVWFVFKRKGTCPKDDKNDLKYAQIFDHLSKFTRNNIVFQKQF